MKFFLAGLLVVALCGSALGQGELITLYDGYCHKGEAVRIEVTEECRLIPYLNDKASSINTHDKCILLYQHDCSGKETRIAPGTPSHSDLRNLEFDDIASSIRLCPKE